MAALLGVDYARRQPAEEETWHSKSTRNDVWIATIEDRAGGAADPLEALAKAKVNLEMVFARRTDRSSPERAC